MPTCPAVDEARRKFRAVLAPWASDLMALRARGLDRPGRRYALGLVLRPALSGVAGQVQQDAISPARKRAA